MPDETRDPKMLEVLGLTRVGAARTRADRVWMPPRTYPKWAECGSRSLYARRMLKLVREEPAARVVLARPAPRGPGAPPALTLTFTPRVGKFFTCRPFIWCNVCCPCTAKTGFCVHKKLVRTNANVKFKRRYEKKAEERQSVKPSLGNRKKKTDKMFSFCPVRSRTALIPWAPAKDIEAVTTSTGYKGIPEEFWVSVLCPGFYKRMRALIPSVRAVRLDQSAQSAQPVQSARPVQPVRPVQSARPIQPVQPVQSAQPIRPVHPTQLIRPIRPAPPTRPAQPFQPARPVRPVRPIQGIRLRRSPVTVAEASSTTNEVNVAESPRSPGSINDINDFFEEAEPAWPSQEHLP